MFKQIRINKLLREIKHLNHSFVKIDRKIKTFKYGTQFFTFNNICYKCENCNVLFVCFIEYDNTGSIIRKFKICIKNFDYFYLYDQEKFRPSEEVDNFSCEERVIQNIIE